MTAAPPRRFRLESLGLFFSWHCDIACHHCLFSSSPRLKGQLPLEVARSLITQAAEVTSARRVVLSGGEPFTDVPYVKAIATAARDAKLAFGIVTNASFATDVAQATTLLQELRAIGLATLTISWDQFHAPFVSPERIRNLLAACRRVGLTPLFSAVVTRSRTLQDALAALGDDAFEVPVMQFRCLPVGRAARKVPAADLLPANEREFGRPCRGDFDSLAVDHEGQVYPCAAVGGYTRGIRLGRIPDQPLAELMQRRDHDLRWSLLANRGPTAFLRQATDEERATLGLTERQPDCVACHRMFSSPLGETLVERALAELQREVEARFDLSGFDPRP